jgi:hypothetical protein
METIVSVHRKFIAPALSVAVLVCVSSSYAQQQPNREFWDEPFEKWNRNQVARIITDSPWARSQMLSAPLISRDSGVQGEKEFFNKFTVRLFSSRPVREAYVRMMQIVNKYDEMSAEARREFDARFSKALNLDVSDRVIVALEFASNDPITSREMKRVLESARTDTIKQSVYLISKHLGRVELREYFPPSADGTGAKFVFPRVVNGKPVVDPTDKEVRFEFYVPSHEGRLSQQKVLIEFQVQKMICRGELSY